MKHSIKRQYTTAFSAIVAGAIILILLANVLFLGSFYLRKKRVVLSDAYNTINEAINNGDIDSDEFNVTFERTSARNNLDILLLDTNTKTIKTTINDTRLLERRLLDFIINGSSDSDRVIYSTEKYTIQKTMDPWVRTEYIELWGLLADGKMILIRTPMEGIKASAALSNQFLVYIGCIAIISGIVVTLLISKRLTQPILEITDISSKMANLDFEAKYVVKGDNEINQLGEHINKLSESLEKTISELKTANNELVNDLEKKTAIDEMRKEFLSNVSHELKTPIAIIQGYAEGLKDDIGSTPEDKDYYCDVIVDEANRMNKIVRNLLELNQIENGFDGIAMERFDIVYLIGNVIRLSDIMIKQNDIKIQFDEHQSVFVWADEFKVEQVVNNYLSNAIHYCKYEKIIDIRIVKNGDTVRISVFNTGDPIPEESIERLWTKFYKVDKARTREYGGSGIGLSIVKAVMESLNQKYGVINHDNGVEFYFELDGKNQ